MKSIVKPNGETYCWVGVDEGLLKIKMNNGSAKGYTVQLDEKIIPDLTQILKEHMHYTNTDNPIDFPPLDATNNEVMDILQEECAEVIQAVSKIRRFGMDNSKHNTNQTNREHLEEELGDMLAMIDILMANNIISWGNLHVAKRAKIEKLKKWSNIQNLENI